MILLKAFCHIIVYTPTHKKSSSMCGRERQKNEGKLKEKLVHEKKIKKIKNPKHMQKKKNWVKGADTL